MYRRIVIWALVCLSVFSSCSAPRSYEAFVKAGDVDSTGRYCFSMEMEDTSVVYAVYLYMRIDASREEFDRMGDIRVDASWISPSESVFEETVYIPKSSFVCSAGAAWDCEVLYRSEVTPDSYGKWQLKLGLPSVAGFDGFRGIGVVLEKSNHRYDKN